MNEVRHADENKDTAQKPDSLPKWLWFVFVLLLMSVFAGVWWWQQNASSKERMALEDKVKTLEAQVAESPPNEPEDQTVQYKTKVGDLTLTLPKAYAIIINVDGNKGGAPGSTLRIGEVNSPNIVSDGAYQWVMVEVGHTGGSTLDGETRVNESKLDGFENIKITDAKVAGLNAKRMTAHGFSYAGNRDIYIVVSGEFTYTVTSSGEDASKPGLLKAVLEGMKIEPKILQ